MELKNQFMTPAELAGYLKITRKTIYRLIKRKKLSCLKVGRSIRLDLNEAVRRLSEVRES